MRNYRRNANWRDPKVITARYNSKCAQTGRTIEKGTKCVYYPVHKQVFHVESPQAVEFRKWKQDVSLLNPIKPPQP